MRVNVNATASLGQAVNLAAGHVGEMAGAALSAAGAASGCPVATSVGNAVNAAGRAWADQAVASASRDAGRLSKT